MMVLMCSQSTVEDQAEREANGEMPDVHETPPLKVDQPIDAVQQLEPIEHTSLATKQLDEPVNAAMSVGQQLSTVNQPIQSPAIAGPSEFPISTRNDRKKLLSIKIPTKPIHTRKLPTFKVCVCCACLFTCRYALFIL